VTPGDFDKDVMVLAAADGNAVWLLGWLSQRMVEYLFTIVYQECGPMPLALTINTIMPMDLLNA
jgi:hypothetical protein